MKQGRRRSFPKGAGLAVRLSILLSPLRNLEGGFPRDIVPGKAAGNFSQFRNEKRRGICYNNNRDTWIRELDIQRLQPGGFAGGTACGRAVDPGVCTAGGSASRPPQEGNLPGPAPGDVVRRDVESHMKILFVCTGNTCRSPMAEGIFRKMMQDLGQEEKVLCQSAGLSAVDGMPVSENAVLACREVGVDISEHTARRITGEELPVWDLYFPMSKTHGYILEQAGVPQTKIYIPKYIADPFGQDLEVYRECRDKLTSQLEQFYQSFVSRLLVFDHTLQPVSREGNPREGYGLVP